MSSQSTLPPLREDGVQPYKLPPLRQILGNVDELRAHREQAVEEGAPPDELAAIDKAIDVILSAEVMGRKADGICATRQSWKDNAAQARAVKENAAAHEKYWNARADWLDDRTLSAMQTHGVTRIETATNRLRVQGNGGLQALDTDLDLLPEGVLDYTFTFTGEQLAFLRRLVAGAPQAEAWLIPGTLAAGSVGPAPTPNQTRIRAALAQKIQCPECYLRWNEHERSDCPRCNGSGSVPNCVPGARLLPRGVQLRVE